MRLAAIEIEDFRSIFADDAGSTLSLDLGAGMNTLVGVNNCGKSNVLRAVSLALDPNHRFEPDIDAPGPRPFAMPIITLRFVADGGRDEERELLKAADAYEQGLGVPANETFASQGEVVLQVQFRPTGGDHDRRELLLTPGHRRPGDDDEARLATAISCLREAVRFVLIRSGESIASVLEGNFREILHSVVRERLGPEFAEAEQSRQDYISGLQESLLKPLRDRVSADVGGLFPEIGAVYLDPEVPGIESTLSHVEVNLEDLVLTPLDEKGTGVRGGVLVAMLSYLALNATRGMVFAVEEPEAFLHPASQEDLRDRLELLAASKDVTLLVTTHSPYTMTTSPDGRVFCLAKDKKGRTRLSQAAPGDAAHSPLLGSLFRHAALKELLARTTALPDGTEAVLLVEGVGDVLSLQLAAKVVGRPELLDDILLRPTDGTTKMIVEAVIARAATDKPVFVLVDNDLDGKEAANLLCSSKLKFQKKAQVTTYAEFFPADQRDFEYEAEDLFAPELLSAFVDAGGQDLYDGMKKRPDGFFHYDLNQSAKARLEVFLDRNARPEHVEKWVELILELRKRMKLSVPDETAAEIVKQATESFLPAADLETGKVLILVDKTALARYQRSDVLILDVEQQLPDDLTHVGFYVDGAIATTVPAILRDYRGLSFSAASVEQLRSTDTLVDLQAADLIQESLRVGDDLAHTTQRVLLLSPPGDPRTLTLPQPVVNTMERAGRPVAWAFKERVVHYRALAAEPTTTTELDEFEDQIDESTRPAAADLEETAL